nr:hypothetical protein CFP56_44420 [Quercus suber]
MKLGSGTLRKHSAGDILTYLNSPFLFLRLGSRLTRIFKHNSTACTSVQTAAVAGDCRDLSRAAVSKRIPSCSRQPSMRRCNENVIETDRSTGK